MELYACVYDKKDHERLVHDLCIDHLLKKN